MDKRTLQLIRMLLLLILWGICGFFIVRLSIDYVNTGRKNTVDIETYQITDLRAPWLFVPSEIGMGCYLQVDSCLFIKASALGIESDPNSVSIINCASAVGRHNATSSMPGYIVNSLTLRELGIGYTNPLDYLNLTMTIRHRQNGSIVEAGPDIPQRCGFLSPEPSTWIALLGDDTVMTEISLGNTVNERDMPAPVHIGLGNVAAISYKLIQQKFINDTIKNGSEFTTTQYSARPPNMIEIRLLPLTFEVASINHKKGQSVIDLLGSIFGWIGVFTGACIFSVLDTAIEAYGKKEAMDMMDAEKKEHLYFVADTELKEKNVDDNMTSLREEIREMRAELENLRYRGAATSATRTSPTPSISRGPSSKSSRI